MADFIIIHQFIISYILGSKVITSTLLKSKKKELVTIQQNTNSSVYKNTINSNK